MKNSKFFLLLAALHLTSFFSMAQSTTSNVNQNKQTASPIVVRANQPNVWTLEQAHYLLAQMHRRNLDLKTSALTELDPNAINGLNIDVLKTLLSVSAEFDQSIGANNNIIGLNNQQIRSEKQFIAEQRRVLFIKRAELQNSSLNLTNQIAELKIKLTKTDSEDEKEKLQAQIDELTIVQSVVKEQIAQINQQLETLPANDSLYQTYTSPEVSPTTSTQLTSALASLANNISQQAGNAPQLNASVRLDNYIQMQYEILSKQLTLLRDEVGPGERLVFMELPQSINVSYGDTKNKLAQSWWRVRGYSRCMIIEQNKEYSCTSRNVLPQLKNRVSLTSGELIEQILNTNFGDAPTYNENFIYVQPDEINDKDDGKLMGIINDFSKREIDFIKKLNSEVPELKIPSKDDSTQQQSESVFQKYVKEYNSAKTALCNENDKKDGKKDNKTCKELDEDYTAKRTKLVDFILSVFRRFMDGELIKENEKTINDEYWKNISKRVADSLDINCKYIKDKNADNIKCEEYKYKKEKSPEKLKSDRIYFRRVVLEEVFLGKIEKWQDAWQQLIDLDEISRKDSWQGYEDKRIRTIDLFPKQSSLNVNDIKLRSNQSAFRVAFSWLTGLGAGASYERMRERYSQFVQQELYSSAFGKGDREFGWTFYPMPGTNRLISGVRTTYAVLIVPEDTTSIILEAKGCFFPRSAIQPQNFKDKSWANAGTTKACTKTETLIVPLPNGGNPTANSFSVAKVSYRNVPKGGRTVVSITGENFSSQIGVVVNGVSLLPSIGIGQPFIRDDSRVGGLVNSDNVNNKIKGTFERVSSREIIATFEMGGDYQGTPEITLIAPGTSLSLNTITDNFEVFDGNQISYNLKDAGFIFGKRVGAPGKVTSIEGVDLFIKDQENLRILVRGEYLDEVSEIFVNGLPIEDCKLIDGKRVEPPNKPKDKNCFDTKKTQVISLFVEIPPQIKTVKVTLLTELGLLDSGALANPAFSETNKADPVLPKYEVKKDTFAFASFVQETCSTNAGKTEVVFRLLGKGFSSDTKAYINNKVLPSYPDGSDLIIVLTNPEITQKIVLQDSKLKLQDEKPVIFKKPEKGCS